MSRVNIKALEEEINFLRITIQHFNIENIEMKNRIEDLKITLNSDKRILQEYLLQITDKYSTVMKLNNTLEQLKKRLENLESQQLYTRKNNNRLSTPERDRTDTNNTKTRQIGNITIKPNKEEQQRALSVIKSRKIMGDQIENKIDIIKKDNKKIKPIKIPNAKKMQGESISNKIDIIKNNQKKKYKPIGDKNIIIKKKQEKILLDLTNIKHKINLIQTLYLQTIEKIKQGKKLTSFVLYDEKEDIKNKKIIENDINFNDIFKTNYDLEKEKIILFMDDKNQIWEITPQPHLNENILKEGNYQFLKSLEEVKVYGNDDDTTSTKSVDMSGEVDVFLNDSFYNENKKYDYDNINDYIEGSDNYNISEESQNSNVAQADRNLMRKYE